MFGDQLHGQGWRVLASSGINLGNDIHRLAFFFRPQAPRMTTGMQANRMPCAEMT